MYFENYNEAVQLENSYDDESWSSVINESELFPETNLSAEQLETIYQINEAVEGKSPAEAEQYMGEFLPALLPLLTSVLPAVLPLIPSAVQAIGSVVSGVAGSIGRGTTPAARPAPPPRPTANIPRPPAYRPPSPAPYPPAPPAPGYGTGSISPQASNSINNLLALLQNSQVMDLLSRLVARLGQSTAIANNGTSVPAPDILGAISNLAGAGATALTPPAAGGAPNENYVFNESVYDEQTEYIVNLFK